MFALTCTLAELKVVAGAAVFDCSCLSGILGDSLLNIHFVRIYDRQLCFMNSNVFYSQRLEQVEYSLCYVG